MKSTSPGPAHEVGTIRMVSKQVAPTEWKAFAEKYTSKLVGKGAITYQWELISLYIVWEATEIKALTRLRRRLNEMTFVAGTENYYDYP